MPHKLGFTVVYASGEDENHRARELECHGPTVRGWQSSRHCPYPQEIVLRLDSKALIQRVQILTHQYLIPERVEFFVGNDEGDEADEVEKKSREEDVGAMEPPEGGPQSITPHHHHQPPTFTHLGYVPLSSNEATGFKARELKSVSMSCTGGYLRLLLHSNHQNSLNTWNQVGLVAVNLLGEWLEDNNNSHHAEDMGKRERAGSREEEREPVVNGDEADRAVRNNCHTSSSQSSSSTSPFASPSPLSSLLFAASRCSGGGGGGGAHGNINENLPRLITSRNYTSPYDDLAFEMYVDTEVATIIRHMEIKKREAVEGERFEYARKLKLAMDELRSAGERLGRWALEKRKAADAEDFERARRKKLQMEEFRAHIYSSYKVAQLLEIHGPLPQNDDPDDPVAGAITMEQLGVPNTMPRHSVRPPLSPSRQQIHPGAHLYQNTNCRQHQVQHRQCAACSSHHKEPSAKGHSASSSHVLSHSPPPAHLPPPSLSPPLAPQGRGCTSPLGSPPSNQRTGLRGSQKKKKATVSPTATNGSSTVKNSYEAYDERTLPALRHKTYAEDTAGVDEWATLGEGGFRLSDREKRQATLPIAVFGLPLVEKFYSKQYTEREEGLQKLKEELIKSSKMRCQSKGRDESEPGDRSEEKKAAETAPAVATSPPPPAEESTSAGEANGKEDGDKGDGGGEAGVASVKDGGEGTMEGEVLQTNGEAKENGEEGKKATDGMGDREARERTRQERVSANKTARAAVFLLHRALKDKVFGVYSLSTEVIRFFFSQFVPSKRVSPGEVSKSVERLLPELLSKSGDCAPRVHNLAMNTIIRMSECKDVREQHLIPMHITKPLTSSTHPRLALSRAEMAEQLILRHGISTEKQSGLTCRVLSELGNSGLHHPSEAVRKASERILVQVYQVNPRVVRKQLPPEDDITRRNLLYRHLFQEFERIDIQRKKDMLQKSKAAAGASSAARIPPGSSTIAEMTTSVDTISYPSPAHTVSSSSSTSSSSIMTSPAGACSGHMPLDTQTKTKNQAQGAWQSRQHLSPVPDATYEDRMCVFCLERNKAFATEEGLNLHYWRNCPMLTRCSHCRQVIEVSALSAHLIGECDAHKMYKQCSRCKLAVSVDKYEEHSKNLVCADGDSMVCPLCHRPVQPTGEDGWRAHLKGPGPGQCPSQSRRRHGRGGSKSPSDPKSAASKSTPSNPPPSVTT